MGQVSASKYMVNAGWDDVPHLDEKTKRDLLASTPPYLREARSKGVPSLGAGAIYPISDEEIVCQPFAIPNYWRKAYGLDVGWNRTAAIWGAQDPADGTIYLFSEHYQGQQLPAVHAQAIKTRGAWVPGLIDPAARGRNQSDGRQLLKSYRDLGLRLTIADNAVEEGIQKVFGLFCTGQLKIFSTLTNTLNERRLYHRAKKLDENGVERVKIVKKNDHLMDAKRYLIMKFEAVAIVRPPVEGARSSGLAVADPNAGY